MASLIGTYTIGALASAVGVHVETIRYYQRRGLVAEPSRASGSVRRYSAEDAERVRFIKRAQAMGFSLTEIAKLISLRAHRSCRATRELAAQKLALIDARIRELCTLREDLAGILTDCNANTEDSCCPMIDWLAERSARA